MEHAIILFLKSQPVLNLFIILGLGVLIGKIKIGDTLVGSVAGVLFIGLIAGHLRLPVPKAALSMGFILFIYCVGVQAGPRFWGAFKQDGGRYLILVFVTAGSAVIMVLALSHLFEFSQGFAPGLLAGALTSTPTLVAAQDALTQGVPISEGLTQQDVFANLSAAYAITYVFGMAGLILFISFMPKIFRIDTPAEAQQLAMAEWIRGSRDTADAMKVKVTPTVRAYRVENEGTVHREWQDEEYRLDATITRIRRAGEVFTPAYAPKLQIGDVVSIVGTQAAHKYALEIFGPEVLDQELLDRSVETMSIVLSRKVYEGKTISEMNFTANDHCSLLHLTRSGLDLPCRPNLKLRRGDILLFSGTTPHLKALAKRLGFLENRWQETDLVTFAFGIAIGLLIGIPAFTLGGTKIGLGSAGGVLVSGLIFGMLHSRYVLVGRLPAAARHILMELGLLLFMVGVAVNAGTTIVKTFQGAGIELVLSGAAVTIVPVLVCFSVGRYMLGMNAALLLGAITGSMTSTAALQQVNASAQSTLPTLGYVGAYAFSNVLLAIAGSIIMRL